jgi:hypothetical protein
LDLAGVQQKTSLQTKIKFSKKLSHEQEITMTENKQHKDASRAKTNPMRKRRFWHWVRVVVSLLSFGFIFPHAMTEDMDIAEQSADKDGKGKRQ